jgi:superfamily II DNA/RNA helicase
MTTQITALPTRPDETSRTFADFGVHDDIVRALSSAGITAPFPIQELTLPLGLSGADIIGQARTGTGKTLAFGIPLVQRSDATATTPQALVIVPTRELCVQVREDLDQAGRVKGTRVVALYGGKSIDDQVRELRKGAALVVGTPGRLLDLHRRGDLDLSHVTGLVLDEADEMLDLGFLPDVERLIEACAPERQTLLFSATMPSAVVALARRYMRKPTFLRADVEEVHIAPKTQQHFFSCHRLDKPAVLARILQAPDRGLCLVFTRTKRMADILATELRERGIAAAPIHSDLRQEAREKALSRFRQGKVDVLVATEVAARGLDIDAVTHVVNYDCPDDEKMYLHRIGRTGRAGAAGVAITLAVWNELARLEMIKKALAIDVETHEVFSTSPILDELFNLPARTHRTAVPVPDDVADDVADDVVADSAGEASADTAATPTTGSGEGRRRSGRSRRGRRGGEARERADAPVEAAPAGGATQAEAATGQDEAEDAPRRRRTRTRSGGSVAAPGTVEADAGPPAEAAVDRPAAEAAVDSPATEAAVDDRQAAATRRRRTRTRADARPVAPPAGSAADTTVGTSESGPSRSRTRTRTTRAPAARSADVEVAARADEAAPARASRPPRGGGGTSSTRVGSTPRTRSGGAERRSDRARSGDRQNRDRGRDRTATPRTSTRATARTAQVDVTEARGDGRPRLRRPVGITHLP